MDKIQINKNNCNIKQTIKNEKGEERYIRIWGCKKEDCELIESTIKKYIKNKPHWNSFSQSCVNVNDLDDIIKKCKKEIAFLNNYYITKKQAKKIQKMILKAHKNYYGTDDFSCTGNFPGIRFAYLMEDDGIYEVSVIRKN